ncbi:MAG: hypothetical protein OEM29_05550 [Thermoplasmata archaeon]|nr:hypothetical protein [Thermoplasmata archaeon]
MHDELRKSCKAIDMSELEVAAIKKLRFRERIVRFLCSWWAPLISGVAGFASGAAMMLASGDKETYEYTSYPYAAAVVGLSMSRRQGDDKRSIMLAVSIVVFVLTFIAGIGFGDAASGESQLGVTPRYGTYYERE